MRKAKRIDKKLVTEILVSAFSPLTENNSINFVVKQDENRIARMYILMSYLFEKAFSSGEVFISDNNKACVLLKYSDKEKTTLKGLLLNIDLAFNCIGLSNVFKVLKRQKLVAANYPNEKHIKPMIIGVTPDFPGTGTAARLILEIKNYYKNNTFPVIIDAADKKNVRLYQKFGFKVFKEDDSLGFPIYFLRLN